MHRITTEDKGMNKNTGYVLRIVLGGYLTWLGINILIQMLSEKPSNMIFISAAAVLFIVAGGSYAIYSLIKIFGVKLKIKIKEKSEIEDEGANEYEAQSPAAQIRIERKSDKVNQQEAEMQADTVEFHRIDVTAEGETREPFTEKEESEKKHKEVSDDQKAEEVKNVEDQQIEEKAEESDEEEQADVILARKGVEVVELSDKEEQPEAEDIETDYEEK